jgi:hypothetical protein
MALNDVSLVSGRTSVRCATLTASVTSSQKDSVLYHQVGPILGVGNLILNVL